MMRTFVLAVGLAAVLLLSACNTIAGVGEDIAVGARTVQDAF
jgi:predicted small secreted protein